MAVLRYEVACPRCPSGRVVAREARSGDRSYVVESDCPACGARRVELARQFTAIGLPAARRVIG